MNERDPRVATAYCHALLPKAGLGNKLLVWARAYVFASINRLPLCVSGWVDLQSAPLMKGDFRFYYNYFHPVQQVGRFERIVRFRNAKIILDPPVAPVAASEVPTVYQFKSIPQWSDYFRDLKSYRQEIRTALLRMLTAARQREWTQVAVPTVCVQVRLGDFREMRAHENFSKLGLVRTPLTYFKETIEGIRKVAGWHVPVVLISEGSWEELRPLLELPQVKFRSSKRTAIIDILTMAASKILVTSAGSTFGYWGAFLGDSAVILHPDHIHQSIRPGSVNAHLFEGAATGPTESWPKLLKAKIHQLNLSGTESSFHSSLSEAWNLPSA